jgi:hypothetical protein
MQLRGKSVANAVDCQKQNISFNAHMGDKEFITQIADVPDKRALMIKMVNSVPYCWSDELNDWKKVFQED